VVLHEKVQEKVGVSVKEEEQEEGPVG